MDKGGFAQIAQRALNLLLGDGMLKLHRFIIGVNCRSVGPCRSWDVCSTRSCLLSSWDVGSTRACLLSHYLQPSTTIDNNQLIDGIFLCILSFTEIGYNRIFAAVRFTMVWIHWQFIRQLIILLTITGSRLDRMYDWKWWNTLGI